MADQACQGQLSNKTEDGPQDMSAKDLHEALVNFLQAQFGKQFAGVAEDVKLDFDKDGNM